MSTTTDEMPVTAVANWFGGARLVAERIAAQMGKRSLVVVPFAGGMSELPYIDAGKLLVNDKHRHVINLARVIADDRLGYDLYRALRREVFHPSRLVEAQQFCLAREGQSESGLFGQAKVSDAPDVAWARHYAICTWMGRGGNSGTRGEFSGALPIRYSPNGGGSAQRFHNWVASIPAWRRVLRKCEFTTDDAIDVIGKCHDSPRVGIYVDSPWPDAGDGYAHAVDAAFLRKLATKLGTFQQARVVIRYADHPLIRELYPRERWTRLTYPSRAQTNGTFDEVLLLNGPENPETT